MTNPLSKTLKLLRLLPKAALMVMMVSAPVLAVPSIRGADEGTFIEAPAQKKTGAGFVLMVSLQRA